MTKYAVYQLPFEHSLHRDLSFMERFQIEELSDEFVFVALIKASTLDEAFRIGNFVCEDDKDSIEIVGEMHSISVGDILHDLTTGETFACESFGWGKIEMKEAV